jgi:transposase InsO family protein
VLAPNSPLRAAVTALTPAATTSPPTSNAEPAAEWAHMEAVEYATLEWVDWFNHRRLLEPIGNVPPAGLESAYHRQRRESALAA